MNAERDDARELGGRRDGADRDRLRRHHITTLRRVLILAASWAA